MIRISRLTDYGTVLLVAIARKPQQLRTASELAELTHVPAPTVSKILKILTNHNILQSSRGAHGGYCLNGNAEDIAIAQIITALEGPIAVTECNVADNSCEFEAYCDVNQPWHRINSMIISALEQLSLKDLLDNGSGIKAAPLQPRGSSHDQAQ